jgi:hypothetical protein
MGATATDKIIFYSTVGAAITQRSSAAQSALTLTTVLTAASTTGFATSAGANALIAQVNEIAATLTALGLWKGS